VDPGPARDLLLGQVEEAATPPDPAGHLFGDLGGEDVHQPSAAISRAALTGTRKSP